MAENDHIIVHARGGRTFHAVPINSPDDRLPALCGYAPKLPHSDQPIRLVREMGMIGGMEAHGWEGRDTGSNVTCSRCRQRLAARMAQRQIKL